MDRRNIVLTALAPANGAGHTPAQVQKLLFLIDKEIPELVGGPHYDFQPYYYGPFDASLYDELSELAGEGYVMLRFFLSKLGRVTGSQKQGKRQGKNC